MKGKDFTITALPVLFLISLIAIAVRPQSNTVQVEKNPTATQQFKVIRIDRAVTPIETELEKETLPEIVNPEKVAKR